MLCDALREKFTSMSILACLTLAILSHLGCTQVPTPYNIKDLIIDLAKHQFKIKPLGTVFAMNSGVATWCVLLILGEMSVEQLFQLYKVLNTTPPKVLAMITEPRCSNVAESRVFNYLKTHVGNMKQQELHCFF